MAFNSMNTDYDVITDNQVSAILDYYSADMIEDTVETCLENRFRDYMFNTNNLVQSLETNFKRLLSMIPSGQSEILNLRKTRYTDIIDQLCRFHNLSINIPNPDDFDYYSCAYFLYDLLISRFNTNIINFLSHYIMKEKNDLVRALKVDNVKKVKDVSTIYAKKIYDGDSDLIAIHTHIDKVISIICQLNISFFDVLDLIYLGQNEGISNYIKQYVNEAEEGSFYQKFFVSYINEYNPIIITNMRLYLGEIIKSN